MERKILNIVHKRVRHPMVCNTKSHPRDKTLRQNNHNIYNLLKLINNPFKRGIYILLTVHLEKKVILLV